jgi:hypothetical protein
MRHGQNRELDTLLRAELPIRFFNIMSLPSVEPPIRVLIRTRPAQLQKVHPSIDQADTELIKRLCDKLSITDHTKISHLITRVSDDKKLERVDIIFDYGSPTIEWQPPVMAYSITVEGPDLIVRQLFHPSIRQIVNHTVKTFESINLENGRCFPSRADTRAETQRQRRAVLPVSKPSFNIRNLIPDIFIDLGIYAMPVRPQVGYPLVGRHKW